MTKQITRTIIVKAKPDKVYKIWRNFDHFPYFMKHIKSVSKTSEDKSRWEMEGPLGTTAKWDAEITRLDPNKRIAWSTKDYEHGNVTTSGQVTFNELPDDETEVTVLMQYDTEGGIAGEWVARLFAKPEEKLEEDLKNFKQYAESTVSGID